MSEWQHTPGSCIPWKRRVPELECEYSVGVNFHGMYQAIKSGHAFAKPVGIAWPTPEQAKHEADQDVAMEAAKKASKEAA